MNIKQFKFNLPDVPHEMTGKITKVASESRTAASVLKAIGNIQRKLPGLDLDTVDIIDDPEEGFFIQHVEYGPNVNYEKDLANYNDALKKEQVRYAQFLKEYQKAPDPCSRLG